MTSKSENQAAKTPTPSVTRNVLANWIWYTAVMLSGFVVPRLIGDHLGQEMLGVWDYGWLLVIYVRWLHLGMTASVNRFVARHRARGEWDELNRTVNTSLALLLCACAIGFIVAGVFASLIPHLLPGSSPEVIRSARLVIIFLLCSVALQLPGGVFNAIITGYERFDVLNLIRVARDLLVLAAIVVLLLTGHGVVSLAAAVLAGELLGDLAKMVAARRLCHRLRLSLSHFRRDTAKQMVQYGGKTVAQGLARGSLYQINGMLLAWFMGPAVLAVYARQRALVMHALKFMKQYAQVFIPKSSALDAAGDVDALRRLMVQSSKFGLYVTLPIIVLLLIMGGPLLTLWMGGGYEAPLVLGILAIGHVLFIPVQSVYSILMGMNRHGMIAVYDFAGCALSVALGLLLIGSLNMGMIGAAIAVAVPLALTSGIIMPVYACRLLKLEVRDYAMRTWLGPILASVPLVVCLSAAKVLLSDSPIQALLYGAGLGGVVTALIYWRWVLPTSLKTKIWNRFPSRLHFGRKVTSTPS